MTETVALVAGASFGRPDASAGASFPGCSSPPPDPELEESII